MRSPCSPEIVKLRKSNRVLLDQLESNSILLERKLKKLKRFARTVRYSDKSWQALPPSPLKRRYESWKTRNYSGQVAAAVNAALYSLSSSSSDLQELDTKYTQNMEDITSPSKRVKQNSPVVSRPKNKELQICECCQSPQKSDLTNNEKVCEDCYCEGISGKDTSDSDVTSQDSDGSMRSSHTGSDYHKLQEPSELHSSKCSRNSGIIDNEQKRRTLEPMHSVIDYSPKSVFLRRLKERSQAPGDFIAPGKIRRTLAKPCPMTLPKKLQTNLTKPTQQSQDKFSLVKYPHSIRHSFGHDSHELISNENQQCTIEQSPYCSPRHTYEDDLELKKNRKHVCHKKHCHCCVQQNVQFRKMFPTSTKEKEEAKLVDEQGLTNPETSLWSPYRCCCDGSTQKMSPSKVPLIASDIVAGLVDNEHDKKHIRPGGQGSKWFNELNEYRQLHWFECHAHPYNSCTNEENARNPVQGTGLPTGHKCVHRYVLDDRLFARPLYSDHQNNSRCVVCHLPYTIFKSRLREIPVVTLPTTLPNPEIQVSVPAGSPRSTRPSVSGNILSHKKVSRPSGRDRGTPVPRSRLQPSHFMRTIGDLKSQAPPPADSWALRYQKGVAK